MRLSYQERVEDELLPGRRVKAETRWAEIKHSRQVRRCLGCRDHAKTSVGARRGCLGSGSGWGEWAFGCDRRAYMWFAGSSLCALIPV